MQRRSSTLSKHWFLSLKFHIHCGPKNIPSSSFPFINISSFHNFSSYWSMKRKRLSFLRVGNYTSLPISTSSACTCLRGLTRFCPYWEWHLRRTSSINSSLLLCLNPSTHWLRDTFMYSQQTHGLKQENRSCMRSWQSWILTSSLSYWFHTGSLVLNSAARTHELLSILITHTRSYHLCHLRE